MTLAELCDVAYVLQADLVERRFVAAAAALVGTSGDFEALLLVDEARDQFDKSLNEIPKPDPVAELRRELRSA